VVEENGGQVSQKPIQLKNHPTLQAEGFSWGFNACGLEDMPR